MTFIGYKQTDTQTDRQAKFIYRVDTFQTLSSFEKYYFVLIHFRRDMGFPSADPKPSLDTQGFWKKDSQEKT